jgi:hypothetical protein
MAVGLPGPWQMKMEALKDKMAEAADKMANKMAKTELQEMPMMPLKTE